MSSELSQQEADRLIGLPKEFLDLSPVTLTDHFDFERDLRSADKQELFILTFRQGRIDIKKVTYNKRHNSGVTLVRLDIVNGQHTNPDGTKIIGPHIHIYREGFNDTIAIPLPNKNLGFDSIDDYIKSLDDFFRFCNIQPVRIINQRSLSNLGV